MKPIVIDKDAYVLSYYTFNIYNASSIADFFHMGDAEVFPLQQEKTTTILQ